jgi:alkylhydroperoxidase family enzyme
MRLEKPRVEPLSPEEMDEDTRVRLGDRPALNIFRTLAHHPKLMKRWLVFGNHILAKSTLSPRDREILILRVGWRCRAEYEFGQHSVIGRTAGLSDEEIARITGEPDAPGWTGLERLLLVAADELVDDAFLSDTTWQALSAHYSTEQMLDLVFTVGQYNLVSMALNSLGVQLDEGVPGFPKT